MCLSFMDVYIFNIYFKILNLIDKHRLALVSLKYILRLKYIH